MQELMKARGSIGAALVACVLTGGALQAADKDVVVQSLAELKGQDSRPWTEAEMRAAIPYPLEREGLALRTPPSLLERGRGGEPGRVEGGLPEGMRATTREVARSAAEETLGDEPEPLGYSYPGPYSRYPVFPNYTSYPFTTVGKLFFKQYGNSYVCSAASIGGYAVWTAGHCVHAGDGSPNGWSTNFVFVPAYKNGKGPYGQWQGTYAWSGGAWYTFGDFGGDMGGVVLKPVAGKKISQKVGYLGFAWNQGLNQHWFAVGYPAAAPFNGLTMQNCAASYAYSDGSFSPAPSGIGCDMTGGCSGGPWIIALGPEAGASNYLNGENSYRYNSSPQELFTPYFGTAAKDLKDCLVYSTPTVPKCSP